MLNVNIEAMLAMELNESCTAGNGGCIRRVPGGWVYSESGGGPNVSCCFVPEPPTDLSSLCRRLAEACEGIRLHEIGCKKRGTGYDPNVHELAEAHLSEAKKAGIIND